MCGRQNYKQLAVELKILYREYREYMVETEKRKEAKERGKRMLQLWQRVKGELEIDMPELLLTLLDAYEVTRDEGMLQEVLDVVSGNLEQLAVSVENVKLLAYCYYYVEEEECAERAKRMLLELRRREKDDKELAEVEKIVEELI